MPYQRVGRLYRPNYSKAFNAACRWQAEYGGFDLPFPVRSFLEDETEITIRGLPAAAWKECGFGGLPPSALITDDNGVFTILYNGDESRERVRFSIMHEAGHFFLNHRMLERRERDISEALEHSQELEANTFAAQMLMPKQVINALALHGARITSEFLIKYFDVSYEAAQKRLKTLNYKGNTCRIPGVDAAIIRKARSFIDRVLWEETSSGAVLMVAEEGGSMES